MVPDQNTILEKTLSLLNDLKPIKKFWLGNGCFPIVLFQIIPIRISNSKVFLPCIFQLRTVLWCINMLIRLVISIALFPQVTNTQRCT